MKLIIRKSLVTGGWGSSSPTTRGMSASYGVVAPKDVSSKWGMIGLRASGGIPGQAPKLLLGRRELGERMRTNTSALSQLTAPPLQQMPMVIPGSRMVRTPDQVATGLGLPLETEQNLTQKVRDWMSSGNPIGYSQQVVRGAQAVFPDDPTRRSELYSRCKALWRANRETQPYRPRAGEVVIQKSMSPPRPEGDGWEPLGERCEGAFKRQVDGGCEYWMAPAPVDLQLLMSPMREGRGNPPELVFCCEETGDDLTKGATHKYIRRLPTGKDRPRWKYIYKLPGRKGMVEDEHLVAGAKFKGSHAGMEGHFEILAHDREKGLVHVRHDESKRTVHIREHDLRRMLSSYHARKTAEAPGPGKGTKAAATKPATKATKGSAPALPRVSMGELAKGEWMDIEGFSADPTELEEQAHAQGMGKQWAVIQQPSGYVLVSRSKKAGGGERKLEGEPTKVFLRDNTGKGITELDAQWGLMEAEDIIASHDPEKMTEREDYPKGVQERRYHEIESEREKVDRIARAIKPAMAVNNNPDAVNGTPILTDQGVVLGGNGRTMAMQRAYKLYPDQGQALKDYLAATARGYGFTAADVRAMKNPILVRKVKVGKDEKELHKLGRRMNEALTQGLDPRSEEVSMGKAFVNKDVLSTLAETMGDDQTLGDYLSSSSSKPLVNALERSGILDQYNRAQYVTQDTGLLNEEGRGRVERILAARSLPDASVLDRMMPSHRANIARATSALISAEENGWDIRPSLMTAVKAGIDMRERGFPSTTRGMKKYLAQEELKETGQSPQGAVKKDEMGQALLEVLIERGDQKNALPQRFRGFALRAKQAQHDSGSFRIPGFGGEPTTPLEALRTEFELGGKTKGEQQELAASRGKDVQDLMKAKKNEPEQKKPAQNRLMNRAIWLIEQLVDEAITASTSEGGPAKVDGKKIAGMVMKDVRHAFLTDKELAYDFGRHPITPEAIQGLVEAFVTMHGQKLAKARLDHWDLLKAAQMSLFGGSGAQKPPAGYMAITNTRHGGYVKVVGNKRYYWYPEVGHVNTPHPGEPLEIHAAHAAAQAAEEWGQHVQTSGQGTAAVLTSKQETEEHGQGQAGAGEGSHHGDPGLLAPAEGGAGGDAGVHAREEERTDEAGRATGTAGTEIPDEGPSEALELEGALPPPAVVDPRPIPEVDVQRDCDTFAAELLPDVPEHLRLTENIIAFPYPAELKDSTGTVTGKIEALRQHQKEGAERILAAWEEGDGVVLQDSAGLGKCQPVHTPTLTPTGWREIGSLRVGDMVIGSDGKPVRVKGVYPRGELPTYLVRFSDGAEVEAGEDHLWTFYYRAGGKRWQDITVTTADLRDGKIIEVQQPGRTSKLDLGKANLWLPMLSGPAEFEGGDLPIPAYMLGQLIANGSCTQPTPALTTNALDWPEVRERLADEGCVPSGGDDKPGCRRSRFGGSGMGGRIRELGLAVLSGEKRIPLLYLQAREADRVALLQGMMDADGSVSKTRNRLTYHTTSVGLAQDVQELVEGMGGIASIREYDRADEDKPVEYQVRIRVPAWLKPFTVERKARRYNPGRHALPVRTLTAIQFTRNMESVCIAVEAEDQLYTTEHCILTHNTVTALGAIHSRGGRKNLIVVPVSGKEGLKQQWEGPENAGLYGISISRDPAFSATADGTYMVSYDDLLVPMVDAQGEPVLDVDGKQRRMRNPALFHGQWDTIVFDEAHNMNNADSIRAQAAVELQARSTQAKVAYLSATPFTHVTDMHYLVKLGREGGANGRELPKGGPWFTGDPESFARWAEIAGADVKKGRGKNSASKVNNPTAALKPMARIAATLHVDGLSVLRTARLEGVHSTFSQLNSDELDEHHRAAFGTVSEIMKRVEEVFHPSILRALNIGWSKQYWETLKLQKAVDLAKAELARGRQVALFTCYKESDHNHLRALPRMLMRKAERASNSDKPGADAQAEAYMGLAHDIDSLIATLPPGGSIVKDLTEALGGPKLVAQIHGATNRKPADEQRAYQEGKKKVVVCTMARGGTGISLHDKTGESPRTQINLGVPWSGREFTQVAGRSHRLGSKSETEMHWILGDDDSERHNAGKVAKRLRSMGALTSGDIEAHEGASELSEFEAGIDFAAGSDDPAEAISQLEAAQEEIDNGGSAEEIAGAEDLRRYFHQYAEARKAGHDVLAEGHAEKIERQKRESEREAHRAAEQLRQHRHWYIEHVPGRGFFVDWSGFDPASNKLFRRLGGTTTRLPGPAMHTGFMMPASAMTELAKHYGAAVVKVNLAEVKKQAAVAEAAKPETAPAPPPPSPAGTGTEAERAKAAHELDALGIRMSPSVRPSTTGKPVHLLLGNTYTHKEKIKRVVGGRGYDPDRRGWHVPHEHLAEVVRKLTGSDITKAIRLVFDLGRRGIGCLDDLLKAVQLGLFGHSQPFAGAAKAPGAGWESIPSGRHGGFRRRKGADYEYWYPDKGMTDKPHPADEPQGQPSKVLVVRVNPQTGKEEPVVPGVTPKAEPKQEQHPAKPAEESGKIEPSPAPKVEPKVAPNPSEPKLVLTPAAPAEGKESEPGKYETTGYVFGSRAELWSLRNSGELEKDPAVAYKLVTKDAVLGGKVEPGSFLAEREAGTEPAAAYLKYRLMQAIQARPDDSPDARQRFTETIGVVQASLSECRTMADMNTMVRELTDQLEGVAPKEELTLEEIKRRGWGGMFAPMPRDPNNKEDMRAWRDARYEANSKILDHYNGHCNIRKIDDDRYVAMGEQVAEIHKDQVKNLEQLGPRFLAILGKKITYPYRYKDPKRAQLAKLWGHDPDQFRIESAYKSDLRRGVMQEITALNDEHKNAQLGVGKGDPWAWLGQTATKKQRQDTATKRTDEEQGDKYHTILAQARIGEAKRVGPPVPGNNGLGSEEMKKSLGLNEVEYGHWADEAERQWHTEAAHAALFDLATLMGAEPSKIGQNGRLTMAFGSRGTGHFKATYHPDVKAINITKIFGKGSLAHEWGHFLDHMMFHVQDPEKGKNPFASGGRFDLPMGKTPVSPDLASAMERVMDTIRHEPVDQVKAKAEAKVKIEDIRRSYYAERDPQRKEQLRLQVNAMAKDFNRATKAPGGFKKPTAFYEGASKMGDYWHRPTEMFARCFEAWVSDKLEGQGRVNTYLVRGAQPFEAVPGFYPAGEHRKRINAAMDQLVTALHADDHFSKSMARSLVLRMR